jgi:hypothetical protein
MATHVYVVSNPEKIKESLYKVGSTRVPKKRIFSRYHTYYPQCQMFYFTPTPYAKKIEEEFKATFKEYRRVNNNNHKSELFQMPLKTIIQELGRLVKKYNRPTPVKSITVLSPQDLDFAYQLYKGVQGWIEPAHRFLPVATVDQCGTLSDLSEALDPVELRTFIRLLTQYLTHRCDQCKGYYQFKGDACQSCAPHHLHYFMSVQQHGCVF